MLSKVAQCNSKMGQSLCTGLAQKACWINLNLVKESSV